jgi:hypothetical protein
MYPTVRSVSRRPPLFEAKTICAALAADRRLHALLALDHSIFFSLMSRQ